MEGFLLVESEWEKEGGKRGDQALRTVAAEERRERQREKGVDRETSRERAIERDGRWAGSF